MRGPFEKGTVRTTAAKQKTRTPQAAGQRLPKVPGGKALARIRYFRDQRSLDAEEETGGGPLQPAAMVLSALPGVSAPAARRARRGPQEIDAESSPYLRAFEELNQMAAPPAPAAPAPAAAAPAVPAGWRPLGPFCIPHGQTYGQGPGSRPSVSGRISAVAVDPNDPNHLLIGAAGGGIWESRDAGASWTPRTDDQPSLSIGAVAFDPTHPKIVYAGTGEGDTRSPLGVGLLRSVNGGAAWTLHARQPFQAVAFFDLLVDSTDPNQLLAATTAGLFQSADGGVTWNRRRAAMTFDLSMQAAPGGTREFLAGCADGLFRSTNGTTWTAVSLPNAPSVFGRLEVAHAPSDGGVAFAVGANQRPDGSISKGFLWRRGSASGTFSSETLPPDLEVGQAWYDWHAAVAPNNPNVLYLGAINLHKGVRSASGTWTWTNVSAKMSGHSIHPDQHALAFSPQDANDVFAANDGGLYRSRDGGVTWQSLNKGLCITEFEFLAQHPTHEGWLLAGTQDNGTLRYQGQQVWYLVQDGDGGDCGVNLSTPSKCFHSFYGMYLERSDAGGAWGSWVDTALPAADNDEGLFYPPVDVNGKVVVKAGQNVYISRNNGNPGTWESLALPGGALATALAIPRTDRIFVGTHRGDILRITRSGGTWSAPTALARPRAGFVSDLLVDPTNPQRLWATYSTLTGSHVFRSDDGGAAWVDVSAGLPMIPVNAVELDPAHPETVFVAADVGVYRSENAGATWAAFSRNLPTCLVKDLLFHPASRLLRAATQSRGVWEIPIDAATLPAVDVYIRDSVVDTGRLVPSPSNVGDPFTVGRRVYWWQSPDIKIDAPTFHSPQLAGVDFEVFEDDQSLRDDGTEFATGLLGERPQRNRPARVYVQVHNRGTQPAQNVAVRAFVTGAAAVLPDLSANFWNNFPNNTVPASSPWQPVAPHATVATIEPGRSAIVGFAWQVPGSLPNNISLLAIASAANDSLANPERVIRVLVPNEKKCALNSMAVVNPPAVSGPPLAVVPVGISSAAAGPVRLRVEGRSPRLIRGLVLPKALAKKARKSLAKVALSTDDREELQRLCDHQPQLASTLDLSSAYASKEPGVWLESLEPADLGGQPILVLIDRKPKAGSQSLVVENLTGETVGGFTFHARTEMS